MIKCMKLRINIELNTYLKKKNIQAESQKYLKKISTKCFSLENNKIINTKYSKVKYLLHFSILFVYQSIDCFFRVILLSRHW
jgi:hypothetical protein